jgi:hypothetical protein
MASRRFGTQLLHRLALRDATRYGRNFGPESALFRLVNDGVNFHEKVLVEAAGVGLHAMIHSTHLIEFAFHPILRKLCTRPIQVRKRYTDVVSSFG